mgnify:CR=1 FL=1
MKNKCNERKMQKPDKWNVTIMSSSSTQRPLSTRGHITSGVVVSDRAKRTVIVQRDIETYIPRYKRYARSISKTPAHNPEELGARMGDVVEIAECRKISKTKAWIVTKILHRGQGRLEPGQVKPHDAGQYVRENVGKAPAKAGAGEKAGAKN